MFIKYLKMYQYIYVLITILFLMTILAVSKCIAFKFGEKISIDNIEICT